MEVCGYPCSDQDANSFLSQLGHPQQSMSQIPAPPMPSPVARCDQIVILDSSRIAMQIASGQIIWPILPKPKDIAPKLEPDVHQTHHPYGACNGDLQSDLESAELIISQADTPLEKCKIRKRGRSTSDDVETHDGDGTNEKQAIMRWKDIWVAQLIHIRGRMNAAFSGPQKQRVDLWQVVKNEMARSCYGFDKDSEACRKKWRRIYKEYKDDKNLHVAGNGSQKCKFYDLMDFYMGERVDGASEPPMTPNCYGYSVKDEIMPLSGENGDVRTTESTGILHGSADPSQVNDGTMMQTHDSTSEPSGSFYVSDATQVPAIAGENRSTKRPYKRTKRPGTAQESTVETPNSVQSMLSELLSIGKEMLETTKQFEQEKMDVLQSLRETLKEISKNI